MATVFPAIEGMLFKMGNVLFPILIAMVHQTWDVDTGTGRKISALNALPDGFSPNKEHANQYPMTASLTTKMDCVLNATQAMIWRMVSVKFRLKISRLLQTWAANYGIGTK